MYDLNIYFIITQFFYLIYYPELHLSKTVVIKRLNFITPSQESDFSKPLKDSGKNAVSEIEIWSDFKQGSDSALSYIYRKYVDQLFNYGCQIINQEEFVQDCIQDLFMDIIRNRENLGNVSSIKYYLFTSLRRKIFRKLKKEKNHLKEEISQKNEIRFEMISSPEAKMIDEQLTIEKSRLIEIACQKLTEKKREAILLYFYEGFSYKQVAEIMGMRKVKSARVMIYRAIDGLQSSLNVVMGQIF